jgi:hypothetical protein
MDQPKTSYLTPAYFLDGIGRHVMIAISTILRARETGLTYAHRPFGAIARGVSAEKTEKHFNLGHGEVQLKDIEKDPNIEIKRVAHVLYYPKIWPTVAASFKAKYNLTPKTCWYDPNKVNVAIHVRRGDITKEKYAERYTTNAEILYVQQQIASLQCDFAFHVFSQGKPEDFKELAGLTLHLDEDPLDTFHHLMTADVLVMAKSSFSYAAALLSDGIIVYSWHGQSPLPEWVFVGRDGVLDVETLAYKLGG